VRASYVFLLRGEVKVWFAWKYINNYIKAKGGGFRASRRKKKTAGSRLQRSPLHEAARKEGADVHGEVVDGGTANF
jgi:hypothetical protein